VSVEHIGRVTQICTDKTETVTLGELKLVHLDPTRNLSDSKELYYAAIASNPDGTDPVDQAIFDASKNLNLSIPTL
jgi:magnesium-transporting ATPase (P-type)